MTTSLFSLALAAAIALAPMPAGAEEAPDRAADRARIAALVAEWENAWNSHDMHALAALFRDDAVWILWTGDVWTGRERFERGMTEVHRTVYRNSVQREQVEEVRFVGPDAAVVRFQSSLTGDTRFPDRTIRSRKLLVVTREAGAWRIAWGQNTRFIADMR
jgi:uncharacterized protein (TIGR02246 family)